MKKNTKIYLRFIGFLLCGVLFFLTTAGCSKKEDKKNETIEIGRISKKISHPPVEAVLTVEPDKVLLERDVFLTIRITAPAGHKISINSAEDRFEGFLYCGAIDQNIQAGDNIVTERKIRLTPLVASDYRIAPIVITYEDNATPPMAGWFYTTPIRLPLIKPGHGKNVDIDVSPKKIPLSPASIFIGIAVVIILAVLLLFAVKLIKKIIRYHHIKQMTPRQRALFELKELLEKKLLEKQKVKDFYVELTFVVRRFIERAYGIRAPELTTEEFLASISKNPTFTRNTTELLKKFLEAADLVKFAAYMPKPEDTDQMIRTAENYINMAEMPQEGNRK